MNPTPLEKADAALDAETVKLLTWKPSQMRNVAVKIASHAIAADDRIFWADDINLEFLGPEDTACIGLAWRMLVKAGILKRTDMNRRSTKERSRGRVVFKYRVASMGLAESFLKRNGWTGKIGANGERLLFDAQEISPAALVKDSSK